MGAKDGIYEDVDGAPFKIGDRVKVVSFSDDTADEEFLGCKGNVLYFEYTCGCGQSFPKDPMIGVRFGEQIAEFWKEELALLTHRPQARRRRAMK
ncbi:MAG TPA: hypothetical protein VN765_02915 [Candidatus Acidoferrum sp.]|nr:hypothetical protein [Candidatus Acidoferrum sp.]